MNIFRLIAVISALAAAVAATAQVRIIAREQVEAAANPKHSSDSALLRLPCHLPLHSGTWEMKN